MKRPMLWVQLLTLFLLIPVSVSAQGTLAEWSHVIRPRWCDPQNPCPARMGMLWDSTNKPPRYPPVLAEAGMGGEVVLWFGVLPNGLVDSSSVIVIGSTHKAFVQSTVNAVRTWRFGAEATPRPKSAITVEMRIVYAHAGACRTASKEPMVAWATADQLVMVACHVLIPRSQLQRPGS